MFKSCQNGNLSGMSCVAFVMMSSDGKWPVRSTRRYIYLFQYVMPAGRRREAPHLCLPQRDFT